MKKRFTKRIISALLVVVMLLSAVPMGDLDLFSTKASAVDYKVGDIIEFGSYPQSEVKDSATLLALNKLTLNWISYGYYSGNGKYGSMVQSDYIKYADVTYNENKYRAVKFTQYRPNSTPSNLSESKTYQYDNGYKTNVVYWFRYEPLKWRVLDPSTGYIMCENIIDSQAYSNTVYLSGEFYNDALYTNYANDWVTSSIRKWLNEDFYNTAFNSTQKSKVVKSKNLDNTSPWRNGKFSSTSTDDYVYLPSFYDIKNLDYEFSTNVSDDDIVRRAYGTDYAKCQGLEVSRYGNSDWVLRSPGINSDVACLVFDDGVAYGNVYVDYTSSGVRPAMCISNLSDLDQGGTDPEIPNKETEIFTENKYIADIWLNLRGGEPTWESETLNMFLNSANMSPLIYNEIKKQKDFREAEVRWEAVKTVFEPDGQAKRVAIENYQVYETLILDLIKNSMEDKDSQTGNIILDAVNTTGDYVGKVTPYKNVISALKSSIDGTEIYDKLKAVNFDINSDDYKKIINDVKASSTLSATTKTTLGEIFKDTDFMGACSMIFDVTSSATSFYQKLTEYMIAVDMKEEMVTLLTEMGNNTSNLYFKKALQNIINSYQNMNYASVICTLGLGADITFSFMSTIFNGVAMAIPIYRELKVVYGLSKLFVNFTLNTEGIMDSYHSCGAMSNFISANKAAISTLANKYKSSGSETDAGAYLYAMKTFEHVYAMDLEVAEKYYKDAEVYGLINTIKNLKEQAINGVVNCLFGTNRKTDFEMFSENKDFLIRLADSLFYNIENSWIFNDEYLQADYPEIYPIYAKKELSKEIYSPNMITQITKDGTTRIDWSIPTFVLTDIGSSKILYGSNVLEGIVYTEKVGSRNQSYEKKVGTVMSNDDNAIVFNNSADFTTFNKYYSLKAYANTSAGRVYTPTATAELKNPIAKPALSIDKLSNVRNRINTVSLEIEDNSLQLYSNIKYTIYRKEGSSDWVKHDTITRSPNPFRNNVTIYTDKKAVIGRTYSYKVVSSYTFGNGKTLSSPESDTFTTKIGDPITPLNTYVRPYESLRPQTRALKSVANTLSNDSTTPYIEVSWDETSGATGYEIYRLASYANSYTLVATVDGNTSSYNDYAVNSGVSYDYFVVPIKTENGQKIYETGTYNHNEIEIIVSENRELESIEVVSAPSTTQYNFKADVSTSGMVVIAKYSDGSEEDVTDRVTVSDFTAQKTGDKTATVEFEGKTATFNYKVSLAWWQWIIKIVLFGWIWYY